MAFEKILKHPDKNEIIKLLTKGKGVRAVSKMLSERYPKDKQLQITAHTLQAFRRDKLNIEGEVLQAIKDAEKEKKLEKSKKKAIAAKENAIRQSPGFKEKVKEAVNMHVEIRKELSELLVLIKARTEDLFDKAARGDITINEEANLQRYFQAWTTTIERWAKYIEKIADKTVETNVNITVIEDQMAAIREAVTETFQEFAPELAPKFLEKLNVKLEFLRYKNRPQQSIESMHEDAQIVAAETHAIGSTEEDTN